MVLKVFAILVFVASNVFATNKYISNYFQVHHNINYLLKNVDIIPDTSYILGMFYLDNGQTHLANYYIWKASQMNYLPAINALGGMFYTDKHDVKTAMKHYKKAAIKGFGPAQFHLGIIYMKHIGDYKSARTWLLLASKNCPDLRETALAYAEMAKRKCQRKR
jgi:TPR repeat protein